jgi:hypothetical protein
LGLSTTAIYAGAIGTFKAEERGFISYDYYFFKDARGAADIRRVMHLLRKESAVGRAAVLPDLRQ